ncbi:hypothetical protein CBS147326_2818 [Penicillium roqueforti]|nr:hypothetical protein CBS147326_2818 [Penicillium roqueforti]
MTSPESSAGIDRSNEVDLTAAVSLLWRYELDRQNEALTTSLIATKEEMAVTENNNLAMKKCLNDLLVVVASIATVLASKTDGSHHRLRLLRRQLRHALEPLREYVEDKGKMNKPLRTCITELERLYLPKESEHAALSNNAQDQTARSMEQSHARNIGAPGVSNQTPTEGGSVLTINSTANSAIASSTLQSVLAAVMKQNNRSIEEYYDAANDFRRQQKRLQQKNEGLFIDAFITGLDNDLYRRRIIHWLRKEGWNWPSLEHMVMFLLLEEEHFEKQEFAMAHQFEDGSVLLPDGTRKYGFIALSPITEEYLTSSDEEVA